MDANTERYYRVLNLEPSASPEDIYKAYRDLVRVWDPQRFANQPHLELMAEDKLKEIIEAYHALAERPAAGEAPAGADPFGLPIPVADHNFPAPVVPPNPAVAVEPGRWPETPPEIVRAPSPPGPPRLPVTPPVAVPGPAQPQPVPAEPEAPRLLRLATHFGVFLIPVVLAAAGLYLYNSAPGRPERLGQAPSLPADAAKPLNLPLVQAPTPHHPARRAAAPAPVTLSDASKTLRTGAELMEPQGRKGAGKFHILNPTSQDAVVRMAEQQTPGTPLRMVYVKAGTEATIAGIGAGVYLLGVSLGPVDQPHSFNTVVGPFQFVQIESEQGSQSDDYRIVLQARN